MSVGSLLRSSYLRFFSQPAQERTIYQAIHGRSIRSIVEMGIDASVRTPRVLQWIEGQIGAKELRYTGIDLFDARPARQPKLLLKHAFATLHAQWPGVRLVPGDPASALCRVANSLSGTDLILISGLADLSLSSEAWIWVPRMLHDHTIVLLEQAAGTAGKTAWRQLAIGEIQQLATAASKARRRAA